MGTAIVVSLINIHKLQVALASSTQASRINDETIRPQETLLSVQPASATGSCSFRNVRILHYPGGIGSISKLCFQI